MLITFKTKTFRTENCILVDDAVTTNLCASFYNNTSRNKGSVSNRTPLFNVRSFMNDDIFTTKIVMGFSLYETVFKQIVSRLYEIHSRVFRNNQRRLVWPSFYIAMGNAG